MFPEKLVEEDYIDSYLTVNTLLSMVGAFLQNKNFQSKKNICSIKSNM